MQRGETLEESGFSEESCGEKHPQLTSPEGGGTSSPPEGRGWGRVLLHSAIDKLKEPESEE